MYKEHFNFALPSVQLARRSEKFLNKLHAHLPYLSLFSVFCVYVCMLPVFW